MLKSLVKSTTHNQMSTFYTIIKQRNTYMKNTLIRITPINIYIYIYLSIYLYLIIYFYAKDPRSLGYNNRINPFYCVARKSKCWLNFFVSFSCFIPFSYIFLRLFVWNNPKIVQNILSNKSSFNAVMNSVELKSLHKNVLYAFPYII